ncbi:helix-turn-helix transcriptional regulator [Microbacterium gorillae]|uniref:helix-turn-helix transcriptional regulator n=1 Tax=Microbacterium gorillae TaxID=1231063 RepID=UPI00058CB788|nr:AraC family transcriptional regulator [Microbacterium gorillae]
MTPPPDLATLRLLRTARDTIDRRFADDLTVGELAASVHLSPAHFARLFRAIYGEAPHQYLMTRRLERAAWLLRSGTGVTDACTAVGFSSLGSFSSRFREVYDCSPSAYARLDHRAVAELPPFIASRLTRPQRHRGESSRNEEASAAGDS